VKRGKAVLAVSAYNTSRECFLCGGINQNLSLEDRIFHCPHCGFTLDRDLNASLVLLNEVRVGATLLVRLSLSSAQYLLSQPWGWLREEAGRCYEAGSSPPQVGGNSH